jgi:hypothetical protein
MLVIRITSSSYPRCLETGTEALELVFIFVP